MSGTIKKIAIIATLAIILAGGVTFYFMSHRMVYNDDTAVGNTTGNLNNGGMFCEYDGKIYFANPADSNKLYRMNSDCTEVTKLCDDSVFSINVYNKYIYYVKNNFTEDAIGMIFRGHLYGVIRCELDGSNPKTLYDHVAGVISLSGNYVYYQRYSNEDAFSFYRIKIDGTEDERLSDAGFYPASVYDKKLYYVNATDDHNIYCFNPAAKTASLFYVGNTYMADMQGTYLYYIDLDNNYSLVRADTNTKEVEVLVDGKEMGKCIYYNLYGNKIFYHVEGEEPALYRMNCDGSGNELISYGNITNISCTSNYTFFQYFGSDALFRVSTYGSPIVEQIVTQ